MAAFARGSGRAVAGLGATGVWGVGGAAFVSRLHKEATLGCVGALAEITVLGALEGTVDSSANSTFVVGRGICLLNAAAAFCVGLTSIFTPVFGIAAGVAT